MKLIWINVKDFQAYADCIRSGQIEHEWMMAIFKADPLFKIWYKFKYCREK